MRLIALINNLLVLLMISVINTIVSIIFPVSMFHSDDWLYRGKKWEKSGEIYQAVFKVKKWKNVLPELSDFLPFLFPKKQVKNHTPEYLYRYVLETCRAELAHWCIIISSLVFFLWNGPAASVLMVGITVFLNLPYIIIQRYNRPRVLRILSAFKSHKEISLKRGLEALH